MAERQRTALGEGIPPAAGVIPDGAMRAFDAARREYDLGRYHDCIRKCRDVRYEIERHLNASGSSGEPRVPEAVAARLGLPANSPQQTFLAGAWRSWVDQTSTAHHETDPGRYCAADARACLLLGAALLEYLGLLFSPPPVGLQGP